MEQYNQTVRSAYASNHRIKGNWGELLSGSEQQNESSFEEQLKLLETIVRRMERGEQSLEDSLQDFQAGIQIVRECQSRLKEAELRIVQLTESEDGRHKEEPLTRD